jgi:tRNA (adenine57-N1/adenine58-N1)-methyltransferase
MRFWHFKGMSARPQHRMVAHTGFLTSARRLADGQIDIPRAP